MENIERAIENFVNDRNDVNLARLDKALVSNELHVPIMDEVKEIAPRRFDVPVRCFVDEDGVGTIPAFTTIENLLAWKGEGTKYTTLTGVALISMADPMHGVDAIAVNPAGGPRGCIPRSEFRRLLELAQS